MVHSQDRTPFASKNAALAEGGQNINHPLRDRLGEIEARGSVVHSPLLGLAAAASRGSTSWSTTRFNDGDRAAESMLLQPCHQAAAG